MKQLDIAERKNNAAKATWFEPKLRSGSYFNSLV
jgi:uncharacterized protein (DUF1015 family)